MIQLLIKNESDLYNPRVSWELVVGVLFCALGIMLSVYLDEVLLTIISLLGTMAIRDAITIQTTINHDIKRLKKQLDPISEIRLEVVRNDTITVQARPQ